MHGYASTEVDLNKHYDLPIETVQEDLLTTKQQHALMEVVRVEDPEIKRKLIEFNLRRVVNMSNRYRNYGVAVHELIREGVDGLIHAFDNFEREGGFRFESYAVHCVRRSIEDFIVSQQQRAFNCE